MENSEKSWEKFVEDKKLELLEWDFENIFILGYEHGFNFGIEEKISVKEIYFLAFLELDEEGDLWENFDENEEKISVKEIYLLAFNKGELKRKEKGND